MWSDVPKTGTFKEVSSTAKGYIISQQPYINTMGKFQRHPKVNLSSNNHTTIRLNQHCEGHMPFKVVHDREIA